MWTQNRVQAAPVVVSRRNLETAQPQAVVVNAGVANAATGRPERTTPSRPPRAQPARPSAGGGRRALDRRDRAAAADGKLLAGIDAPPPPSPRTAARRAGDPHHRQGPKTAVAATDGFTVGGMAKGAGMIHPCLATMLAVVTTDYPLAAGEEAAFLRPAVERTFNRISVDGDCSTNDAVVLLANGKSGSLATRDWTSSSPLPRRGVSDLARQIVADGRGRPWCWRSWSPAPPRKRRRRRSRCVWRPRPWSRPPPSGATRTGGACWPRPDRRPRTAGLPTSTPTGCGSLDGTPVFAAGAPTGLVPELAGASCRIELDLGLGDGEAAYLASDLSYDYVKLNAEYTT